MSIKVMTYVWDGFPSGGSELLAMLAMADWCNDQGGSLHPSIKAIAKKIRVGEKHARNIIHSFEVDGYLTVIGNQFGGAPGATKQWRLNVAKLKALADAKEAETTPVQVSPTPNPQVSPTTPPQVRAPLEVRAPLQVTDGSPVVTKTAPPQGSLTTIEPSIEPPYPDAPSAHPPELVLENPAPPKKPKADDMRETALQIACKATWTAYASEYASKYGAAPVRNAKVNANVKAFVQRIGHDEAPGVAAFFVNRVSEAFVVRKMHEFGLLLASAESYRTQWATNQSMTATRAGQIDKTQSNFDAAGEAMAILRAKREVSHAG